MATATTAWGIPYPELTDPPDGATQMKSMAERIDALFTQAVPVVQSGVIPNSAPNNVATMTFTTTFPRAFTAAPLVLVNMNASGGGSRQWDVRVTASSATSFSTWLFAADAVAATFTNAVTWLACLPGTALPNALTGKAPALPDGWHYAMAACSGPECLAYGMPISAIMVPDAPDEMGWQGITCGACWSPMVDTEHRS